VLNTPQNSGRIIGIVIFVAVAFVACVVAMVCIKTGSLPTDLVWFDENGIGNVVQAVLRETRYEIAALGIAALNAIWITVRC